MYNAESERTSLVGDVDKGGLPFPSPGDHPAPGVKPTSPALAGKFFATEPPGPQPRLVDGLFIESGLVRWGKLPMAGSP